MSDAAEDALKLAQSLYRRNRESWFNLRLRQDPHERESESDAQRQHREDYNAQMKAVYDEDTEAILAGEKRALMPMCMWDMLGMRPPEVTI